jgi:hypothetical protein
MYCSVFYILFIEIKMKHILEEIKEDRNLSANSLRFLTICSLVLAS